jgi:hypothetical protein
LKSRHSAQDIEQEMADDFNTNSKPQPGGLQHGPPAVIEDEDGKWNYVTIDNAYLLIGGGHREVLRKTGLIEWCENLDTGDELHPHAWPMARTGEKLPSYKTPNRQQETRRVSLDKDAGPLET